MSGKSPKPPPHDTPSAEERFAANRIVGAARAHFFAHGFRNVTMDQLADELGMSKKTLYAHFPSKSLLLEAVIAAKFEEMRAALDRITSDSSTDFMDSLHQLLACMHRHTEEIQPPFIRDMRREEPGVFQSIEQRRREIIQRYFGKLFQNGRSAGIIRKDVPVRVVVEILLAATQSIMNPVRIEELKLTPKTGFSAIISVILEGIITDEGRAKR
jgi:AcrR family transcriptional regulator